MAAPRSRRAPSCSAALGCSRFPPFLLTPMIVTQENSAEVYKDDATLFPLTQG
ncbi:hypothetical protein HF998_00265 [Cellulomonas hominis]|nr:hypothetical protein [Cellulomonas hominis]